MRWCWLSLFAMACASAPAPKVSFVEALAEGEPAAPTLKSAELVEAAALTAAVRQFNEAAAALRAQATKGAPMPSEHVAAWSSVLDAVDATVSLPAGKTSVLEAVRTRLQLEDALNADGYVYGDIDHALVERAQTAIRALAIKVALITHHRRPRVASGFTWPLWPVQVTSPFGERVHPILGEVRQHLGLDLLAGTAQPIYAAASGTVTFAGWNGSHGKHIEVQHGEHLATSYSHLSTVMVEEGAEVDRGTLLGLAGSTGRSTGVHLHFEVHRDGEPLDPEAMLPSPEYASFVGATP